MLRRTFVVLGKELRVLGRDRRLIGGVLFTSLIAFPALVGLTGNIDRLTGTDEEKTPVVVRGADAGLLALLGELGQLELLDDSSIADESEPTLRVEQRGRVVEVLADGGRRRLFTAARQVVEHLEVARRKAIDDALAHHQLSFDDLAPFAVELVDTGGEASRGRRVSSAMVPYLVVLLLVSNSVRAMYVAVGEKEKNTLASLLVSVAPRSAIVLGKSLAIVLFSVFSSVLLVAGLTLAARLGLAPGGDGSGLIISPAQAAEIAGVVLPLALFVAAVVMLIGTWARSQREAGIYAAPLVFLSLFLALFSFSSGSPGVGSLLAPILGNAVALREILLGSATATALLLPATGNLLLAAMLVGASVALYRREEVLFRQ